MLGARLFADLGATATDEQVGNPGNSIAPMGARGVQAGDYAIWINASAPWQGWSILGSNHVALLGKRLTSGDLSLSATPSDQWGLAVYRDVTSAVARAETGFAKSPAHAGVVAVSYNTFTYPSPASLTTPEGARLRLAQINAPTFFLYDVTAPNGPYVDGTAFTPAAGSWDILELLRS